jgi:hypothetical protein
VGVNIVRDHINFIGMLGEICGILAFAYLVMSWLVSSINEKMLMVQVIRDIYRAYYNNVIPHMAELNKQKTEI